VLDEAAGPIAETVPEIAAEHFGGRSQAIAFDEGRLALIHEAPGETPRSYQHRFVWFDKANGLRRLSRAFYFARRGIEFAAGFGWPRRRAPDDLLGRRRRRGLDRDGRGRRSPRPAQLGCGSTGGRLKKLPFAILESRSKPPGGGISSREIRLELECA